MDIGGEATARAPFYPRTSRVELSHPSQGRLFRRPATQAEHARLPEGELVRGQLLGLDVLAHEAILPFNEQRVFVGLRSDIVQNGLCKSRVQPILVLQEGRLVLEDMGMSGSHIHAEFRNLLSGEIYELLLEEIFNLRFLRLYPFLRRHL